MKKQAMSKALAAAMAALTIAVSAAGAADDGKTYKVFIYAGQSNARGKAPTWVADAQLADPAIRDTVKDLYAPVRKDGNWVIRDDVFFNWPQTNRSPTGSRLRSAIPTCGSGYTADPPAERRATFPS